MNEQIKKSLYGLTSEMAYLELATDNLDSSDMQQHGMALANLEIAIKEKSDSVVYYYQSLEDSSEILAKRIKELQEVKKALDNKTERYEKYVTECLGILGLKEITGKHCSIKMRTPAKAVQINDADKISMEYLTIVPQSYTINKKAIADSIKAGNKVDGAELVDGKQSLMFKVK